MSKNFLWMTLAVSLLLFASCTATVHRPSDPQATETAHALYERLFALLDKGVMVGHQDDIAYGYQRYEPGFSDVYDMTGDYPAVVGWEIGHVELGAPYSLDSVYFDAMRRGIIETAARGGISTISWHGDNPLTGGSTWDCSSREVVASILPGGPRHEAFLQGLDRVAAFLGSLKSAEGEAVPVVLRLYHEHTGSWFWWGADLCTPDQYKKLWRMTVGYLRGKGIHNVLYAYSPAGVASEEEYLERYPGDEWVDVVGFDYYFKGMDEEGYIAEMQRNLNIVCDYAARSGKLPVVAETGLESVACDGYFTRTIASILAPYRVGWILFWRNAWEADKPGHFYLPYKGHPAADDFKAFIAADGILMNKDIQ